MAAAIAAGRFGHPKEPAPNNPDFVLTVYHRGPEFRSGRGISVTARAGDLLGALPRSTRAGLPPPRSGTAVSRFSLADSTRSVRPAQHHQLGRELPMPLMFCTAAMARSGSNDRRAAAAADRPGLRRATASSGC